MTIDKHKKNFYMNIFNKELSHITQYLLWIPVVNHEMIQKCNSKTWCTWLESMDHNIINPSNKRMKSSEVIINTLFYEYIYNCTLYTFTHEFWELKRFWIQTNSVVYEWLVIYIDKHLQLKKHSSQYRTGADNLLWCIINLLLCSWKCECKCQTESVYNLLTKLQKGIMKTKYI